MKRMLFTVPDSVAQELNTLVPSGERSKFVVRYLQIPLGQLKKKKMQNPKNEYSQKFLKDIKKAEKQIKKGKVYSQEDVMREFGLL